MVPPVHVCVRACMCESNISFYFIACVHVCVCVGVIHRSIRDITTHMPVNYTCTYYSIVHLYDGDPGALITSICNECTVMSIIS